MKSEKNDEQKSTNASIDNDRKHLIECAIVRIMKTRKTLAHVHLVNEVIAQVGSRFSTKMPVIKVFKSNKFNIRYIFWFFASVK